MADATYNISFDDNIEEARRHLQRYQRKALPRAAARALNVAGGPTYTEAKKRVRNVSSLKKVDIENYMTNKKATVNNPIYRIRARRRSPNILRFMSAAQISSVIQARNLSNKKRAGKTYMKAKAWGKNQKYYRGFIGKVSTGNPDAPSGVRDIALHRIRGSYHIPSKGRHSGRRREKLDSLKGPSLPKIFSRSEIIEHLRRRAYARFKVEFPRQLKYYISRL